MTIYPSCPFLNPALVTHYVRPVNDARSVVEISCSRRSGDVHSRSEVVVAGPFVVVARQL